MMVGSPCSWIEMFADGPNLFGRCLKPSRLVMNFSFDDLRILWNILWFEILLIGRGK